MSKTLPIKFGCIPEAIEVDSGVGDFGGYEYRQHFPNNVPVKINSIYIKANDDTLAFGVSLSMVRVSDATEVYISSGSGAGGAFGTHSEFVIPAGWFLSIVTDHLTDPALLKGGKSFVTATIANEFNN